MKYVCNAHLFHPNWCLILHPCPSLGYSPHTSKNGHLFLPSNTLIAYSSLPSCLHLNSPYREAVPNNTIKNVFLFVLCVFICCCCLSFWCVCVCLLCCLTNCHQLSGWKQHAFIFSPFLWVRSPIGIPYWVSQGCNQGWLSYTLTTVLERKYLLPSSFMFLADIISLWLYGWDPYFLTSWKLNGALGSETALRSLPCGPFHRQFTTWLLSSSRPERKFISHSGRSQILF